MKMGEIVPLRNEAVNSLAMALVESSKAPLLLLDDEVVVIGASSSFCNAFNLDPARSPTADSPIWAPANGMFRNSTRFSRRRSPEQRRSTLMRWTWSGKAEQPAG
jgi:hypothetical protein